MTVGRGEMAAFRIRQRSTLLYSCSQPSTDMAVLRGVICWTSLPSLEAFLVWLPTCLVSLSPACLSRQKAEEPSTTGCMVGVRHWRAVEHQSMHVRWRGSCSQRGSCLQGWWRKCGEVKPAQKKNSIISGERGNQNTGYT